MCVRIGGRGEREKEKEKGGVHMMNEVYTKGEGVSYRLSCVFNCRAVLMSDLGSCPIWNTEEKPCIGGVEAAEDSTCARWSPPPNQSSNHPICQGRDLCQALFWIVCPCRLFWVQRTFSTSTLKYSSPRLVHLRARLVHHAWYTSYRQTHCGIESRLRF